MEGLLFLFGLFLALGLFFLTASGQKICEGHAAFQFLYEGDVHGRYGILKEEGSC